jgi:eukaryotic-like serine/threonine-protein kinase
VARISTPPVLPPSESFSESPESDRSLPSEPEVLPAGFGLGSYVIHSCIGRGAMGSVYRAEHTLLKKHVALKIMDPMLLSSSEARQRFLREAQAAAAIKHPNVVAITDTGVIEGMPYLVMELLDGIDLDKHLENRGPLSEQEVAALALPIVAALGVAHDIGVVHRDLKPGNIFLSRGLDDELVPKVLDFGVSKFAAFIDKGDLAMTPFDSLMGSPLYLPPEAVHGARDLTAKSDQYSLAVVLYECITGTTPFERDSLLNVLNAIAKGEFEPPRKLRPGTSIVLERAILRAMSADPRGRFEHIRDLGRALLEVADVRTQTLWGPSFGFKRSAALMASSSTPPQPLATKEPAPSQKAPSRWRSLAGFALAVLGLGLLWTLTRRDPAPPETSASETPAAGETGKQAAAAVDDSPPVVAAPPAHAVPQQAPAPVVASGKRGALNASEGSRPAARAKADARQAGAREVRSEVRSLRESSSTSTRRAQPRNAAPARANRRASGKAEEDLQQFFPQEGGRERNAASEPSAESTPVRNEAPILD